MCRCCHMYDLVITQPVDMFPYLPCGECGAAGEEKLIIGMARVLFIIGKGFFFC